MSVMNRIKGAGTSHRFNINRSVVLGVGLLLLLFIAGTLLLPQFGSSTNIRSMLLLAAFLGLASLGQTLCALLGGIDMSIAGVIGASNILLAAVLNWGIPWLPACLIVLLVGIVVGILNGALSFRIQGQSLIMTMGVGLVVVGACQIIISIGSVYGGTVLGSVPQWLRDVSSITGTTFELPIPPIVVIWIILSAVIVTSMSKTFFGRSFYAVGGNRLAASRILISEYRIWLIAYAVSGGMSALTGMALLGFSGGGFVGVGDPYLFTTIAAVVIGGTSLMGGWGGYGSTLVGTLVLTLLTTLLVGFGLSFAMQQAVFGLLIVPVVALYARDRSISDQI